MKLLDDHPQWHYADACLTLRGVWQADQVARVWSALAAWQGVQRVDLTQVTQIDSSLSALLVALRASIEQTLLLSGISDFVRALLSLYDVEHLFFEVVHEGVHHD